MMKISVVALLLSTAQLSLADRRGRCHQRELELCAVSWTGGGNQVPASPREISNYCENARDVKECVETFVDECMTPMQKEVIAWAMEEPMKQADEFCSPGSPLRTEYLRYAPCLAKARPAQRPCQLDIQAAMEKLEITEFRDRIPMLCCMYRRYEECTAAVVQERCGDEANQWGAGLLQQNFGVSFSSFCAGIEANSTLCRRLLPAPGTRPTGQSKSMLSRMVSAYLS